MPVEVIHFNPKRREKGVAGRIFFKRRRIRNFGDLIGPALVRGLLDKFDLEDPHEHKRLVAVGSIMSLTQPGDVVWGTGVNGKSMGLGAAPDLDIRAVRGPRTRDLLIAKGARVPKVFGDPALLWPILWPRHHYLTGIRRESDLSPVTVVPNFNDLDTMRPFEGAISPLGEPHDIIGTIARSRFVCGSSLHAIIIAEAYGIPARLLISKTEHPFKYDDYYSGTGRDIFAPAATVEEALEMGGEAPVKFDSDTLLATFPQDLFQKKLRPS